MVISIQRVCLFQSHLLSVFDNIRYVTFEEKMYDKIVAIISQEGENVPLQEHVMAVVINYCSRSRQ